jgi:hypothetical protein
MRNPSEREDKEYTGELKDALSESFFSVTIAYSTHPELSIESYDLEGDNITREELVDKFGLEQVERLEEELV